MWSTFYYNKKHNGFLISLFLVGPKLISSLLKFFLFLILKKKEKKKYIFTDILVLLTQYQVKHLGIDQKSDYLLICIIFNYKY